MRKKLQYALLSTLAAFIIIPSASVNATETDTTDKSIVEEYTVTTSNEVSDQADSDKEFTSKDLSSEETEPDKKSDDALNNSVNVNTDNEEFDFTPNSIKNKAAKRSDFISKASDTILVDETGYLTLSNVPSDYTVSFKSSDKSKLSIKEISNVTCEYTGKTAGTAHITVKIKEPGLFFLAETITFKYKVNISPRAVSVKFNKRSYTVSEGDSIKPKLTIRPSISKEEPEFDVSNPKVISVNSKGKVHGKNTGTSYLTATISNGKSAKCKVIVKKD